MVATLYLVRHGALEGGGQKRYNGSIDIPLSSEGIAQMRAASSFIAEHLRSTGRSKYLGYLRDVHGSAETEACTEKCSAAEMKAVYCSDLSRAVTGAEIIAEPYGLKPVRITALRERSFGVWEGMTFTEIKEKFPAEFEAWARNPLKHSPPGGESTQEVAERALTAFEQIIRDHSGDTIAVVAHGGVNRIILCNILGMPLDNIFRIEQDYAAVNVIEFWDKYPVVKLINGQGMPPLAATKEVSEGK